MSSKIDALQDISLTLSKEEPLTAREKIVNIFQELEGTKDEQRQVNTELDKEIQARIDAESEASHLRRQVQLVEVNVDNTTARVNHLTTTLIEVVKVSEAARHACTNLENKLTAVKDNEINLDDELHKAKEYNIVSDKRYQENATKLTELQERIEHAERRSTIGEQRIVSLEQDIRRAQVEMKSLMQTEEKTHAKDVKYQKDIEDLQSRLKAAQHRSDEGEVDVEKLQLKVDQLKEKLVDERNKCQQIIKMIAASTIS